MEEQVNAMWLYDALFWGFSTALIASAVMVVLSPTAVASAMFLILCLFFTAGLFILLHAFFLGVIQILVYAGAVMVLYLFVIMLLDPKVPRRWWFKNAALIGAPLLVVALLVEFFFVFRYSPLTAHAETHPVAGTLAAIVKPIFSTYLLPLEVTGLILLVASIGVVVLGRRDGA